MLKRAVATALMIPLVACATIVGDSSQLLVVNSNPDQADIRIVDENGLAVFGGKTPASVNLKKSGGYFDGKDYTVTVKKDGYSAQTIAVNSSPNGWYLAGNILVGGLIGWFIVDPITGSMWTLSPEAVSAQLETTTASNDEIGFKVVLLEDVDESLRDDMVALN